MGAKGNESTSVLGRRSGFGVVLGVLLISPMAIGAAWGEDQMAANRRQIESMTPAEKERLRQRLEWFAKLDPAEQERLRELHRQLESDPNAEQLHRVMRGYCQWLKELPPYRRAELLDLDPAARVRRIKQMRDEEARNEGDRPKREDMEGVFRWMEQYVKQHADEILQEVPEPVRKQIAEESAPGRQKWAMWMMWQRWLMPPPDKPLLPSDEDLAELRSKLSEETRLRLESKSPEEQRQTITGWIRYATRQRFSPRRFRDGPLPPDFQKRLQDFFENELEDQDREQLLSLPGDEMQRRLQQMYWMRMRPFEPPRGPHGSPSHGRRPDGPPDGRRDRGGPPERDRSGPRPPEDDSRPG
ncbi:MAG: hypothetical protein JXB62_07820 [Pirellulales bacterium]|nr:hypothetical protein [Pirellulales bacterium]